MTTPIASGAEFRILVLVEREERTGLAIADAYEEEAGDTIAPGTLYAALSRMHAKGWIRQRDGRDTDGRLRYFKATADGIRVIDASRAHYLALAGFLRRATT